jgi:hypothetical protein
MTFAYFAFAQYLVVWGGDMPRETSWYLPRVQTTWRYAGLAVVASVFALPVIAMLFRAVKRNPAWLAAVCGVTLAGAWLDAAWLVLPSLRPAGMSLRWIDIAALVAQGGLWLSLVSVLRARRRPRMPMRAEAAHG